jgi:DNA end-binding protein Ku
MAASVWRGYLSFGLVTFPIRLTVAARRKRISFHMLHDKDFSRVKEVLYCALEDKPIDRTEIVKGYEKSKDQYIVVPPQEIDAIAPPTAQTIEILQFVKANEIDPVYLDASYYVNPDQTLARAYNLLMQAMAETEYDAIAQITMHGREHVALIRPGMDLLVLHTMYYADELNRVEAAPKEKAAQPDPKELELAKKLIESLVGPFRPEQYRDSYRENLEKLIHQKETGQPVTSVAPPKAAPVVNILEALQKSLQKKAAAPRVPTRKMAAKSTRKRKPGRAA